jgi:NifU-like protein involved in Fe-S cluster formation
MTDDPLYRREILRLAADATGAGHLSLPDASATVHNPACGDRICVELAVTDGKVTALAHATHACVLTQAAAALLANQAPGLDRTGLQVLAEDVRSFLKGGSAPTGYEVFDGVAGHAGRHVCVLLPLDAALKALGTLESANPGAKGAKAQTVSQQRNHASPKV